MSTRNISKEKRERLISKIEEIKTHADDDTVSVLNEVINELNRKKYGLVWEEHSEVVEDEMLTKIPVFTEDKKREIKLRGDKYNFILEGDNLHSLKLLEKTHKGKIDIIYIDPPYNTGSQDWKYNNDYVDDNDRFRHSKWLSMMYKRLEIAKRLLSPNGALICAIDDNEQANLLLVLDDMFGMSHDITCVTVVHNPRGTQADKFSYVSEYAIFITPKNVKNIAKRLVDDEDVSWRSLRRSGHESLRQDARNCFYPIYIDGENVVGFGDVCSDDFHPGKSYIIEPDGKIAVYPVDSNGVERKWGYARQTVEDIKDNLICKKSRDDWDIHIGYRYVTQRTVWDSKLYDANAYGSQLLSKILTTSFPFPKSLYLVEDCLNTIIHDKDNALILDFFAGSGTTGQAVLEMNKNDGGNRKFILCTNNELSALSTLEYIKDAGYMQDYVPTARTKATAIENKISKFLEGNPTVKKKLFDSEKGKSNYEEYGICRGVTYHRIKTIMTGVRKDSTHFEYSIPDNLKYYKTDFINKKRDGSVPKALLKHVKELIQLETLCTIDNKKICIAFTDDEIDAILNKNYEECEKIFVASDVLLTSRQNRQIEEAHIDLVDIPEYYFSEELREVDEV